MSYCHGLGGNQVFAYTKRQQVFYISLNLQVLTTIAPGDV